MQRRFSNLSEENFNLLTRKGVFPYEYIDCRKIGGTVFTILRVVLQFNDRQHYIWERLRHQCVAAVFHPDTRWIAIYRYIWKQMFCCWFSKISATIASTLPPCIIILSGFTWDAMLKHRCKIWTAHRYWHSHVYRAQYTRWFEPVFKQICAS